MMGELLVKEIAVDVDKPRLHVKCKEVGEDSVKTVRLLQSISSERVQQYQILLLQKFEATLVDSYSPTCSSYIYSRRL